MKLMSKCIALYLAVAMVFIGCQRDVPSWVKDLPESVTYDGSPVTAKTSAEGKAKIESPQINTAYEVNVVNEGKNLKDFVVEYTENNGKSVIHGYDALNRYTPFVLCGTPDFIKSMYPFNENQSVIGTDELVIATILCLVAVGLITYSELEFIFSAFKVQSFYIRNAVDYYNGELLTKTTFQDLSENIIYPRYQGITKLVDIGLTYISLGVGDVFKATTYTLGLKLADTAAKKAISGIRDQLVQWAVESWGISMDQALNKEIYVVIDLGEADNGFEAMYASYRIYLEDPENMCLLHLAQSNCPRPDRPNAMTQTAMNFPVPVPGRMVKCGQGLPGPVRGLLITVTRQLPTNSPALCGQRMQIYPAIQCHGSKRWIM